MAIGALAADIAVAWACSDGAVTVNWGLMDCSGVLVAGGSCVPGAVGLDDVQLLFLDGVVLCRPAVTNWSAGIMAAPEKSSDSGCAGSQRPSPRR